MKIYVHWFENLKPTAAETCELVYCGSRRGEADAAAEKVIEEKGGGVVMWIDGTRPIKVKTAAQVLSAKRMAAKLKSAAKKEKEERAAAEAAKADDDAEKVPVAKKKAKRKRAAKKAVADEPQEAQDETRAADVPAESGGMAAGILEGNNELL